MKRDDCFDILAKSIPDHIVVSTYTSAFEWIRSRPHSLNYLAVGAMGLASSHGLGLALALPNERIVVLDGDGSLLMNLGTMATIAGHAPRNLVHVVVENGTYEANGGHPIPAKNSVDFLEMAKAAGYSSCFRISDLREFESSILDVINSPGPVFLDLQVVPGAPLVYDYPIIHGAASREAFRAAVQAKMNGLK